MIHKFNIFFYVFCLLGTASWFLNVNLNYNCVSKCIFLYGSYKHAYLVVVLWKFSAVWNLKLLIHSYKYFYRTLLFFRTFCSVSHMSFQRKGTYNFLAPITNWLTHSITKLNSCMRCLLYKLKEDWIHIYIIMLITLIPDLVYLVPSLNFCICQKNE